MLWLDNWGDDECIGPEGSCELSALQRRSLALRNREAHGMQKVRVLRSRGNCELSTCFFHSPTCHQSWINYRIKQLLTKNPFEVHCGQAPLSNDSATALNVSTTSNTTSPASACASGRQIPFSNRGPGNECFASSLGDECEYVCNDGYIGVGRHVCQTIYIENEADVRWWK